MHEQPTKEPTFPAPTAPIKQGQPRWRLTLGVLMSAAILIPAFVNRAWLWEAIGLARAAQPAWLLLGLLTILGSFLISSQIFQVALRALGHRAGMLRLWATATDNECGADVGTLSLQVARQWSRLAAYGVWG